MSPLKWSFQEISAHILLQEIVAKQVPRRGTQDRKATSGKTITLV